MTRTVKTLKSIKSTFADGSSLTERFAVIENGVRIGTVYKTTCDGVVWYDPLRGNGGAKGDGKFVVVNFLIQRCKSMEQAIAKI